MKKQLLFIVLVLAGMQGFGQAWQATHLTSVTYFPVVMEAHQDQLYATVFNSATATLNRLNSDNSSWSTISTGSDITVPRFLKSAGTKLYISTVNSGVFSMIYYTTDGGATYVPDTVGLPRYLTGVALAYGLQYYKGKMIVAMGGNGYYLKDTAATSWHHIDVPTAFNAPSDPLTYFNDTLYAFDNSGASAFYVSGDWGTTWSLRTTDLPGDFGTRVLVADDVSGRIYAAGAWSSNTVYGLKYSDDGGTTWTAATSAASFMHTNYTGAPQQITAIYAHSPLIYLALENDHNSSAPDIVGSATGLSALAYDTTGLPATGGAANGTRFLMYQGKLTLSLNVIDVFIKNGTSGIAEQAAVNTSTSIFPNPCHDKLHIDTGIPVSEVTITDITGRIVWHATGDVKEADMSHLQSGTYLVQQTDSNGRKEVLRCVKE